MSYRDEIILEIETVKDIIAMAPGVAPEYTVILQRLENKLKELN
jgi:hypothetical protein